MGAVPTDRLVMTLRSGGLGAFYPLLQQGVLVPCRVGATLEDLLVSQWGIDAGYVAGRITTLFVNSRAVDNVATTVVPGGGVVALSGAMPGLVGATLRRGGFYAAMRGAMTCREDTAAGEGGLGRVRVKLFNLLLEELGPGFLARGVVITAAELSDLVAEAGFSGGDFTAPPLLNGNRVSVEELLAAMISMGREELLLTARFEGLI